MPVPPVLPVPVAVAVPTPEGGALGVLSARAAAFGVDADAAPALREVFATTPDPRDPRGVRHRIEVILGLCTAAMLSDCQTLVEITTWITHADQDLLSAFGCRRDQASGLCVPPHPDTVNRLFAALDAAALADLTGAHLGARAQIAPTAAPITGPTRLPALAIDGKAVRGAIGPDGAIPYLLAAATHTDTTVIAERAIGPKTNEVRREVPCRISHSVRRNSEGSSWIHRLTRISKDDGDQSMPAQTWRPCPRVGAVRQGGPRDMANAGLREAQSPVMQVFIHRKTACETGAALCVGLFRWPVQPLQRRAMPSEGIEGDEWDA